MTSSQSAATVFERVVKHPAADSLLVLNGRQIPMALIRNPRARRYILRLRPDGSARVTIPRGGSAAEARRFAERNKLWVERELLRLAHRPNERQQWKVGTEIHFRGDLITIESRSNGESRLIAIGSALIEVNDLEADLRPAIEEYLRSLAVEELPRRVFEMAAAHQSPVRRVSVRNQRSRWGSCSRRGTISLNWRLVQTPPFVQDYLILHELAHFREMNHSTRFWRLVERTCPDFRLAERWLKEHSSLLISQP